MLEARQHAVYGAGFARHPIGILPQPGEWQRMITGRESAGVEQDSPGRVGWRGTVMRADSRLRCRSCPPIGFLARPGARFRARPGPGRWSPDPADAARTGRARAAPDTPDHPGAAAAARGSRADPGGRPPSRDRLTGHWEDQDTTCPTTVRNTSRSTMEDCTASQAPISWTKCSALIGGTRASAGLPVVIVPERLG